MSYLLDNEFWDRNTDPRVRSFPLMTGGPWNVLAICAAYVLVAKLWQPSFKNVDMRPWLLIQNGFAFGCHGAGFFVALTLSGMGSDGFDCSPLTAPKWSALPTFEYIKSESLVHLAYVLLMLRIFLLTEGLAIRVMNDKPLSSVRILNEVSLLFFCYIGFKYLPGGPSLFFGMTYLVFYTFSYGYYTLKSGSLSNSDLVSSWKSVFIGLQFAWAAATLYHFWYLMTADSCRTASVVPLAALEGLYSIGLIATACNSLREKLSSKIHVQ